MLLHYLFDIFIVDIHSEFRHGNLDFISRDLAIAIAIELTKKRIQFPLGQVLLHVDGRSKELIVRYFGILVGIDVAHDVLDLFRSQGKLVL